MAMNGSFRGRTQWRAMIACALAAAALSAPASGRCNLGRTIELPVQMASQLPLVAANVDGRELPFVVDSGALLSMIDPSAAAALGLTTRPAPRNLQLFGVGGGFDIELATVRRFGLGGRFLDNVEFLVGGTETKAAGLLGQNVLGSADTEYDLGGGRLSLFDPSGCSEDELVYWAGKSHSTLALEPVSGRNRHIVGTVLLNGQPLRAAFDTGAVYSIISLEAGQRAGFRPGGPGVVAGGTGVGLGQTPVAAWLLPAATLRIGDQEIRSRGLRMADIGSIGLDMLIGADFFLSHRVFVANSRRKLLFTYAGGPVFGVLPETVRVRDPETGLPVEWTRDSPVARLADAEAYARRGMAALTRRDTSGALADLDRAVAMKPAEASFLFQRAQVRLARNEALLGRADLDTALEHRPDLAEARVARARLFVVGRDRARARQDLEAASRSLPRDADLRLQIAATYIVIEDWAGAIAEFDLWLAAHPRTVRSVEAYNGRCWSRAMLGTGLTIALEDCEAALRISPGIAALRDSRALIRLRLGDLAGAIADYDAVLAAQPELAWSLLGRGLARRRSGREEEGKADIAAAVARDLGLPEKALRIGLIQSVADPR